MKKLVRMMLVFVLSFSLFPISVMAASADGLGEVAGRQVEKTYSDLGLPASDWCGYFVGYCINHSSAASSAGENISNGYARNPMTLINWACAKKQIGTYYSFSPAHYNRLVNAYHGLSIISTDVGEFTPIPGDMIVYDWNGRGGSSDKFGHIGIVTDYDRNASKVTSVEGNTETGNYTYVKKITHNRNYPYIIGYIRLNPVEKCTVTFDPNGGNVSPLTKTVLKGGTLDSLPIPTRSGYTFTCWSTVNEGAGAALVEGNYEWMTFDQDTTLYAMWYADCVSHTYDAERCTNCGEVLSYDNGFDASAAGMYQVSEDKAYIRTGPYQVKELVRTPGRGEVLQIAGSVVNSYNNCWLKTADGYYVYADRLVRTETTSIGSTDDQTAPSYRVEETWGSWSGWSSAPVSSSSDREVETRQVKISDGSTEYRYGRYVDGTGRNAGWCAAYLEKLGYSGMSTQYSGWSTSRYPAKDKDWTCGFCSGSHTGVDHYSADGRGWWKEYVSPESGNFFWEESRQGDATYETQYRYRVRI